MQHDSATATTVSISIPKTLLARGRRAAAQRGISFSHLMRVLLADEAARVEARATQSISPPAAPESPATKPTQGFFSHE